MTNRRRLFPVGWACVLFSTAAGCGDDGDARVKTPVHAARGEVFSKGKPLSGALVTLKPSVEVADVPWPTGRTDAEGKFRLHTYADGDGAPAGAYKIGVKTSPSAPENRSFLQKVEAKTPSKGGLSASAAARYADPENSSLTFEVKPGDNEIPTINLD
ncbi:MAG: hypothetical protein P4L85_28590 [Paludisphaera borealis]|uniref:hypothetical protein n=1 Tax=Paludisphaera borealis TaxID=1387353 RepID=UPI00284B4CB6|nr:hypothetical protein [Paludisphaera borealis]MDR3623325.1 hypothetical protein [Paludisphaera borealis]